MFLCHSFPLFSVGERSQLQYNHVLVVVVVVVVVAVVVVAVVVVVLVFCIITIRCGAFAPWSLCN